MKIAQYRLRLLVPAALILLIVCAAAFRGEIRAYYYRDYIEVPPVQGSNWFDYPVGAPNARGYYCAQHFGGSSLHLGEDWNGMGGGNSDYGDPVYSIAYGKVVFAEQVGVGWGNVVRIVHPVKGPREQVEAVYAHLARMEVREGDVVKRGQVIGIIGDADGSCPAHLHLEIRRKVGLPLGGGYGHNQDGLFLNPSQFINEHRKR